MIREKRFYFFSGGWKTIFWLIGGKTYKAMVASINLLWNDKAALKASGYLGSSAVKPSGSEIMNQASKISRFKNYYKSELFWLSYGFSVFVPDFRPLSFILVSPCILKPPSQCFLCLVPYIKGVAVSRLGLLILKYVRSYIQAFPHPPQDSEFPFTQINEHWDSKLITWIQKLEISE